MTIEQKINQLIVLREAAHDSRQREALQDAITMMKSCAELYIKAYMRGYHCAKIKGDEA